jgi:hypothetical protein
VTITNVTSRIAYTVPFKFFLSSELAVVERIIATGVDTVLTEGVEYTVTGGGGATGTVVADTAPASTVQWIITRTTARTQQNDYVNDSALSLNTVESDLDRNAMRDIEIDRELTKALQIPESDDPTIGQELPSSVDRASKYLGFDADGQPLAVAGAGDATPISAFATTLVDDADAPTARATLGAQEDVVTTRGDLVVCDATPEAVRLPLGTSGQIFAVYGSDPGWLDPATVVAGYPPFYISGFAMDGPIIGTTWGVNIGIGSARVHTTPGTTHNTQNAALGAAFTKKLDGAAWAAGTGANGLADGATAKAADNWYAAFVMSKSAAAGVDIGFDSSAIAANLKADSVVVAAGFDRFRFIGWVQVNAGNADVDDFFYNPDSGLWQYRDIRQVTMTGSDETLTLDIPEGDIDVLMGLNVHLAGATDDGGALFRHLDGSDGAHATDVEQFSHWVGVAVDNATEDNSASHSMGVVRANSSKQIRFDQATTTTAYQGALRGFYVQRSDR